jgi:hypothetical protein
MSTAQIPGRSLPTWSNQTHQLHDRKLVDLEVIQTAFEDMHVVIPQCKRNLETTLAQMATSRQTSASMTANRLCAGVARMQTMQTRRHMDITLCMLTVTGFTFFSRVCSSRTQLQPFPQSFQFTRSGYTMTSTSGCIGPGEPLPPVPLRNPRRVETSPMNNDRGQMKDRDNYRPTEPPSPTAQKIFQEIDREIEDTQQRLVSAVFANRAGGVRLQAKDIAGGIGVENMKEGPSEIRRSSLLWSEGDNVSRSSTSSSLTDGLKRYSAYLSFSRQPSLRSTEEKAARQRHIEDAAARLRISYDSPESPTTIASYDGASNADSMAQEDARVEAWLARRGSFAAEPSEVDRVSQTSMTPTAASEQRRPARTVAPSQFSGISRREYASPLSPMNNGRDAYGNFIPTNTQDYLNSQSPPSSPPLRPIMEDAQSGSTTTPSLRGGGNWWHIGLGQNGKEPSVKKGRSTPKSERSSILKSKTSLVAKDPPPSSHGIPQTEGASANPYASAKARSVIATDYEWSDEESERSSFDLEQRRLSKLLEYGADAQSRNARIGESTTLVAPNTPASSKPAEITDGGFPYPILPGLPAGAKERLDARGAAGLKPPRRLQADDDRTESPFSDLSYETRREKRWNKAPSEAPAVMPPPPPPKDAAPPAPPSYVKPITHTQYAYEYGQHGEGMSQPASPSHYMGRAPSLDDPRDEEAWELQSLQVGESVSVVGGPRRGRALAVARPPVPPINAEQYKAQQLTAQAEFRGLCQEIMMRYNAEISRLQREFQRGALSQERLRHHKELLDKNRANALKHSAKSASYVVSTNRIRVSKAMQQAAKAHS